MLLILRSTSLFSSLIAASPLRCGPVTVAPDAGDLAEPVVTPLPVLTPEPDDCAVPAALVPGVVGDARLDAFPAPLGSSPALFNPPGAAGPGGTQVTLCEPAPAEPALGEPAALPLLLLADEPPADPPVLCANEMAGDIRIVIAATAAAAEANFIGNLLFGATTGPRRLFLPERFPIQIIHSHPLDARRWPRLRKLIAFDDDTLDKLTQLARDRMATFQELADEAFADLLKKHGIPIDLKDALRKSAGLSKAAPPKKTKSKTGKTPS
jgi:hypothetical protein